ncbi:interleukin-18-like isoform X2 [Petaurus breviceps papuanus]|uniref:interleukin-18-like isoform X2 n=1 Tax=Petaurus breviceps papuanus TaxID=3040969 RepID=UPI0036DB2D37
MAAPTNYPAYATEVAPEADPNSVNTVKPECEPKFSKVEGPTCIILRNTKEQVLMLKNEREAVFEEMTDSEIRDNASQTQFMMQHYKDTDPTCSLVAFSVKTPETTYTMSCKDKSLFFKEGAAPDNIIGEEKDILFCEERVIGYRNKMYFKSLLYPQYYLACENESEKYFLILKERDKTEEESTVFKIEYCEKIDPQNNRDLGLIGP